VAAHATRYAVECQSSYERGDAAAAGRGQRKSLLTGVTVPGAYAPLTEGGARWTLIVVRAEVGPFRRFPCQSLAHADTINHPLG